MDTVGESHIVFNVSIDCVWRGFILIVLHLLTDTVIFISFHVLFLLYGNVRIVRAQRILLEESNMRGEE